MLATLPLAETIKTISHQQMALHAAPVLLLVRPLPGKLPHSPLVPTTSRPQTMEVNKLEVEEVTVVSLQAVTALVTVVG